MQPSNLTQRHPLQVLALSFSHLYIAVKGNHWTVEIAMPLASLVQETGRNSPWAKSIFDWSVLTSFADLFGQTWELLWRHSSHGELAALLWYSVAFVKCQAQHCRSRAHSGGSTLAECSGIWRHLICGYFWDICRFRVLFGVVEVAACDSMFPQAKPTIPIFRAREKKVYASRPQGNW